MTATSLASLHLDEADPLLRLSEIVSILKFPTGHLPQGRNRSVQWASGTAFDMKHRRPRFGIPAGTLEGPSVDLDGP